jgi:hypothetical protein
MQHAFNAYVTKVLESLTVGDMQLSAAKALCRLNIQQLELSYLRLEDTSIVANRLVSH